MRPMKVKHNFTETWGLRKVRAVSCLGAVHVIFFAVMIFL